MRSYELSITSTSWSTCSTTSSGTPIRSANVRIWSTPPTRKLSSVTSLTRLPSTSAALAASFAIVVVLPAPVGPTSMMARAVLRAVSRPSFVAGRSS
jgi:hypothetical protein